MLNGFRQHTAQKAASFRWRLLFWLFAAFAGIEAPLGAQEALSGKSSATASTPLSGALRGHVVGLVAADGVPSTEIAALTKASLDAIEPLLGDDGPPHGDVVRDIFHDFPPASQQSSVHRDGLVPALAPAGFRSRAPPLAA